MALPVHLSGLCQAEVLPSRSQLETYWNSSHLPFHGSASKTNLTPCSEAWCPLPFHYLAAKHLLKQCWVRVLTQLFPPKAVLFHSALPPQVYIQALTTYCTLLLYFTTPSEVKCFFIYLFVVLNFLLQTDCVAHFHLSSFMRPTNYKQTLSLTTGKSSL